MFIITCENCGREQRWGEGVTVGQGTVIEVADRAVFCECGRGVEEDSTGRLNGYNVLDAKVKFSD